MKTYKRFRYPSEIISHAVWLYHRFCLSFRDVEELLAARGIIVSYETIRRWCMKFGQTYAHLLKKSQGQLGDQWFLDEVFIKINGRRHYLWRAVDQDNNTLEILVQTKRNKRAALKFLRKLLKSNPAPNRITTDKLRSYSAAINVIGPSIPHDTDQYSNNIVEISHQPTRQRERQMRKFKSAGQAQRFLACHAVINNHFRLQRHLLKAKHYRFFRKRAFDLWSQIACAQNLEAA
jgi:putative transposase